MRHNDYRIIDECHVCRAPIFQSHAWSGRTKDGTTRENPRIPTCKHVERKVLNRGDR